MEMDAVEIVAELMRASAITAPKGVGHDSISAHVCTAEELEKIEGEMMRIARETTPNFERDAKNLKDSQGCILIGVKKHTGIGLNCGACGYATCAEFNAASPPETEFHGPNCMIKLLDMGIALGSAAKTAQLHNIDNRIMYRVGVAARNIGMMPECNVIMGIPLYVGAKSIYFDR